MNLQLRQSQYIAVSLLAMFCTGTSLAAEDKREALACNRVVDEAEDTIRVHGVGSAIEHVHSAIVNDKSLSTECRVRLSGRLAKMCREVNERDLHSCSELIDQAVVAADIPLDEQWQFTLEILWLIFEKQRRAPDVAGAEQTLDKLQRQIDKMQEPIRGDYMRGFLERKGDFYLDLRRLKDAEGSYSELLTLSRRSGSDGSDLLFSLQRLASVYEAQGRWMDARNYLEQAIGLVELGSGKDSPALVLILEQYSGVLKMLGEDELAAASKERATRLR